MSAVNVGVCVHAQCVHVRVCYIYLHNCRADIALIGLAVMGQNLILNMNDHGFVVSSLRLLRC